MVAMEQLSYPSVQLTREAKGVYLATNAAGAQLRFGPEVEDGFSAVELLLVALAGCSGIDLDYLTTRRAEPERFTATASATKVGGSTPAILRDIDVAFDVAFPEGPDGDQARARIGAALRAAEERTCTVSRTVAAGVPVVLRTI